jgi:hypothetical protein
VAKTSFEMLLISAFPFRTAASRVESSSLYLTVEAATIPSIDF